MAQDSGASGKSRAPHLRVTKGQNDEEKEDTYLPVHDREK